MWIRRFAALCATSIAGVALVAGAVAPAGAAAGVRTAARPGIGSVTYCYQEGCDNQNPPTIANARTGANCASGRFAPSITSPLVSYDIWVQTQNGNEQSSHYAFPAEAGVQFFSNGLYAPDAASACVQEYYNHRLVDQYCSPAY